MEIRRFRADLCGCLFAMGDRGWTNIVGSRQVRILEKLKHPRVFKASSPFTVIQSPTRYQAKYQVSIQLEVIPSVRLHVNSVIQQVTRDYI